jgi:type II secretory pathway pseudopilin PulG
MKTAFINAPPERAFTLTEILTAMALFSLVIIAVLSLHLFGLRMYRISESKLSATGEARVALNQIRDEIRSGKTLLVGTGDATAFTPPAINANQIGNALQIYPSTDTNQFVRYYLDATDQKLKRLTSGTDQITVLASYITNDLVFAAENHQGQVLTNDQNNRVIRLMLDFFQWQYPISTAGSDGMYDYYQLNTRITRRTIE